jgi:hypothetical protein
MPEIQDTHAGSGLPVRRNFSGIKKAQVASRQLVNEKCAMWACQACMNRRLRALVGDAPVLSPFLLFRQPVATSPSRRAFQRSATGKNRQTSVKKTSNSSIHKPADVPSTRWEKRQEWLDSRGVRPAQKPVKEDVDQDFVVRKHLQYLKDPLKLAEHVRKCLRAGDLDTTLAIVRAASKSIQCTVSWNHLIEWYLSQGKMKSAIRTYNEVCHICWCQLHSLLTFVVKMKKRAQVPDARTFTIIFNGAASHPSATEALGRIVSIYQSMLTDRSPVKPNTIHVNAILKMCARTQNMDAMFAIADQLPPKGLRAPNNLTYTTIINALRMYAVNDLRSTLTPEQKEANRRKAMLDARRIWQDVGNRWQQGDIWIDEELVCAMGRILLLGGARDHDDIMSLVEQAMNIPRQAPRLPITPQKLIASRSQENAGPSEDGNRDSEFAQTESETANYDQDATAGRVRSQDITSAKEESETTQYDLDAAQFQSILPKPSAQAPTGAYAKPGSNTLSLLMQSLLYLRLKEPATAYWNLFTNKYGVKPDADNYHAYLRILRVARASSDTVKLLREMPRSYLQHKTFRIAMSTCQRDKNNPNVFANSGKILDMMQDSQEIPDMISLHSYLDLALVAPVFNKVASDDTRESKLAQGRQIMRALDRLGPSFVNVRSLLLFGHTSDTSIASPEEFLKDVLTLVRKMISAHDALIHRDLVPASLHGNLAAQRSKLSAFVTRYKHRRSRPHSLPSPIQMDSKHDGQVEHEEQNKHLLLPDDDRETGHALRTNQAPRT